MKSIIRTKSEKMLLTVNITDEEFSRLCSIMEARGGKAVKVPSDSGNEQLGYLLGFSGFAPSGKEKQSVDSPAVFFSGVDGKELNEILAQMRQDGIRIDLKAVCTAYNQSWTLADLIQELAKEHAYMNGGRDSE